MPIWNSYYLPESIDEALNLLTAGPGPARLVAGGTDLLLDLQQGRHPPVEALVDVTRVVEMTVLETRGDHLFIGAAVPLSRCSASPLVRGNARALVEACGLIGGPQVRNTATLGGNVGHALPAADGAIALLALDAQAEVARCGHAGQVERRLTPLIGLYAGPGKSALDSQRELIVGFRIPLVQAGEGSAFQRVMRPQGVALPILNMATWVRRRQSEAGEVIDDVRISVGPAGPVPQRATAAEEVLRGKRPEPAVIADAVTALGEQVRFRSSPRRSTAEYRRMLSASLLEAVLKAAWQRTAEPRTDGAGTENQ